MWNEFEHVEDGRFDPDRDGYYGEHRKKSYEYDEYEDYDEDDREKCENEKRDRANFDEICEKLLGIKEKIEKIFKEEEAYRDSLREAEQWTIEGEISYNAKACMEFSVELIEKIVEILE